MSALQSTARPQAPRHQAPARALTVPLRGVPVLVPMPSAVPSGAGFVVTCVAMMAGTLLGLLGLNVAIASNSFTVDELQTRQAVLLETEHALRLSVAGAASPQQLDERARALGMVGVEAPVMLAAPPEVAGVTP